MAVRYPSNQIERQGLYRHTAQDGWAAQYYQIPTQTPIGKILFGPSNHLPLC